MQDRKRLLARLDLFAGLGESELEEIAGITRKRRLEPHEVLCHKGDEGGDVYVIVSGRIKAFATGPDGDEVVFQHQGPGEVVGELGMFVEGKRTASLEAVEPTELLVVPRRDFLPVLRRIPDIGIRLLSVVAARVIRLTEFVEDANFRKLDARLAKCVLGLADRWGERAGDGVRIPLKLSQTELGDQVGGTRESVNKQIRAWTSERVLVMHDGVITIKNRAALEALTRE